MIQLDDLVRQHRFKSKSTKFQRTLFRTGANPCIQNKLHVPYETTKMMT